MSRGAPKRLQMSMNVCRKVCQEMIGKTHIRQILLAWVKLGSSPDLRVPNLNLHILFSLLQERDPNTILSCDYSDPIGNKIMAASRDSQACLTPAYISGRCSLRLRHSETQWETPPNEAETIRGTGQWSIQNVSPKKTLWVIAIITRTVTSRQEFQHVLELFELLIKGVKIHLMKTVS